MAPKTCESFPGENRYLQRFKEIESNMRAFPRLSERGILTKIEALVQERVWIIWHHVRENKNRLDSGRVCNFIEATIEHAVQSVRKDLADLVKENQKLAEQLSEQREISKQLHKELKHVAAARRR